MSSRESILGAVRDALGRTAGAPVPPPPAPIATSQPPADPMARFVERLSAVGGRALAVAADAVAATVLSTLRAAGARSVVLSDDPRVEELAAPLTAAGIACLGPDAARALLLAADAGITSAQHAIAESGTLVLDAGAERSRLASLVPPLHLCLLPRARLLPTLGAALAALPDPLPHAVTFVTGPSRTADIELQLVVGVHGPKDLCVLVHD